MSDKDFLALIGVGVALWIGYRMGQRKGQQQQAQQYGDGTGSGSFAMTWFQSYGKGI